MKLILSLYKDYRCRYTDEASNTAIPLIYDDIRDFSEGQAYLQEDRKEFHINR